MKIGIDISVVPYGRGVANYIVALLTEFQKLAPEIAFQLYCNSPTSAALPSNLKKFPLKRTRIPNRLLSFLWLDFEFPPIEWVIGNVDLFHSPAHSPVYALCPPARKWVVTVHDLFTYKLNYNMKTQEREWKILKRIEKKASHVIAVSNSTKNDLLELIPSLEPRVSVIYEGVNSRFGKKDDYFNKLEKYGIRKPYILHVGSGGPNKNVMRLLEAFNQIKETIDHHMVLVGDTKWRYAEALKWASSKDLNDRMIFPGFVSDEDLPAVYSEADLFVCPSLYEGFGLVVLEAMACECPVIASNTSSLPEVISDAGLLFDPSDTDRLAELILLVVNDSTVHEDLQRRGLKRASEFSWEFTAQKTLEVYQRVVNGCV